jgi:hypothetical protein
MGEIASSLQKYKNLTEPQHGKLIAISKTKPNEDILDAYGTGHRDFGENKVQELVEKYESLPKDIQWHMVGHLQRNKVKYIAPFVHLIHSVDSLRLLKEIDKQAHKNQRIINVLLQVHIAQEETKFGFDEDEINELLQNKEFVELKNICVIGLMGMATYTEDMSIVEKEFKYLQGLYNSLKKVDLPNVEMRELSMGMTNDFKPALKHGSTMIRIGTAIFGERNYG